jgi:predicted amidohydrolase YtcJ
MAAEAEFQEQWKGTITPNKVADLVVLSQGHQGCMSSYTQSNTLGVCQLRQVQSSRSRLVLPFAA